MVIMIFELNAMRDTHIFGFNISSFYAFGAIRRGGICEMVASGGMNSGNKRH